MSSIKSVSVDGDIAIGRNIINGGNILTRGNAKVERNLTVKGWLDAPNIRGGCKGLFATEVILNSRFPKPQDGWWAYVGGTLPAPVFRGESGAWVATGETGGTVIADIDRINQFDNDLEAETTRATNAEQINATAIATEATNRIAAIVDLNPKLLRGVLYYNIATNKLYTQNNTTSEYTDGGNAVSCGLYYIKGDIAGLAVQGDLAMTIFTYTGEVYYMRYASGVWTRTEEYLPVTQSEKTGWNAKVGQTDFDVLQKLVHSRSGLPSFDSVTNILTFTAENGAQVVIDLPLELIGLNYDAKTQELVFLNSASEEQRISLSAFIDTYLGSTGDNIQVSIDSRTNTITATMLDGSIGAEKLSTALQNTINGKVDKIQGKGLTSNDFTTLEKNKLCNLAAVATTGNYSDLSNIPITEITPDVMNRLTTSHASKVYILIDGTKRGLLIFECFGPSSARQTLYMDGIVKKREALSMNSWQEWTEIGGSGSDLNPGDLVIAAAKTRGTALSTRPYTDFAAMTAAEKELIVGIVVDAQKRTFVRCMYKLGQILSPDFGGHFRLYEGSYAYLSPTALRDLVFPQKYDTESGRPFKQALLSGFASNSLFYEYAPLFYCANIGMHGRTVPFDDIYYPHTVSKSNYVPAINEINRLLLTKTKYADKTIMNIYREIAQIPEANKCRMLSSTHYVGTVHGGSIAGCILATSEGVDLDSFPVNPSIFYIGVPDATNFYKSNPSPEINWTNVFAIFDILP